MKVDKTAIFIDGSNLYATAKALRIDIDYKRLRRAFGDVYRAMYYTAIIENEEFSSIRPLVDWLDYNEYNVVSKPTKEFFDANGRRKIKGNMDIEIAVDAMELSSHIDHAILFTGDGDFVSVVHALHRAGVRVTVVSSIVTQPPIIADELRRVADRFIDLNDIRAAIERGGDEPVRSRYG